VISNSKQELSTPSNRQSLSQPSTPEVPLIVEKKDEEMRKETTSLTKVKDFEDYVREAIQSGLLDKQYEVSFHSYLLISKFFENLTFEY